MSIVTSSATMWQYRRKKRRILSPVARGLIVGVLFCGWFTYSVMFKQDFDVLIETDDAIESSSEIFDIENSEQITNSLKTPFNERNDHILFSRKGKNTKSCLGQLLFILKIIKDYTTHI